MTTKKYNRAKAISYAKKWAYGRNPKYYDYENLGGDCTSFVSQALYAGSGVMNFTPDFGWYYINANDKSPSWSGVEYQYDFLTKNKGVGPFGTDTDLQNILPGDIIQLKFQNKDRFSHSLIVVSTGLVPTLRNTRIATHSFDAYNRPLYTYNWSDIRFIHIDGVRTLN